jgi:tRNA threonylcarbamoyladenosine biosynthesis protein TsaB
MLTLAIELSSSHGSVALVSDVHPPRSRCWGDSGRNRQRLYDAIQDLLQECGLGFEAIDFYTVGRGPGSFSGMRTAFAAAAGLALPDGKEIFAVSSGEALAAQQFEATGAEQIAVAGDARRNKIWLGTFEQTHGAMAEKEPYRLLEVDRLKGSIEAGTLIVSPEAERIAEGMKKAFPNHPVCETSCFPDAATLGALALRKKAAGIPSEEHEPLYMHPPVFVAPKYA